jgi:hypothetical protein
MEGEVGWSLLGLRRNPLSSEELPGDRAVEEQGMRPTVIGAFVIAGVFVLVILLVRFPRDQSPEN